MTPLSRNSYAYAAIAILAILFVVAAGFDVYLYHNNNATGSKILALQNAIKKVDTTLASDTKSSSLASRNSTPSTTPTLQENTSDDNSASHNTSAASADTPSLTSAVSKTSPAVVSIIISQDLPQMQVMYIDPFADGSSSQQGGSGFEIPIYSQSATTSRQQVAAGSGFIVRSDGYILTNKHVVSLSNAYYTVLLASGAKVPAQVVYRDPSNDLALLKISGTGYPTVTLGDSSTIQVGESVAAIGNALGQYSNTVSTGIISGLNRTIQAYDDSGDFEQLKGVLQTDAAINPGNSGGPLIDYYGNVLAINVATAGNASNISFAIPINEAKAMIATATH